MAHIKEGEREGAPLLGTNWHTLSAVISDPRYQVNPIGHFLHTLWENEAVIAPVYRLRRERKRVRGERCVRPR